MTAPRTGRWTEKELATLRERYPDEPSAAVAALLGRPLPRCTRRRTHSGWRNPRCSTSRQPPDACCRGVPGAVGRATGRAWTDADVAYLREHFPHERTEDVARAVGRNYSTTAQKAKKLGLKKTRAYLQSEKSGRLRPGDGRGVAGRFRKGMPAWNKGQHHPTTGRAAETQFRAGALPHNTLPVGTYRVSKDGYLERKYQEARGGPSARWRSVHRLVWEAEHGPTPAGHVVVFRAGQRTAELSEITLDRLELITRQELMQRNTLHRWPDELRALVRTKAVLTREINKQTRRKEA